LRYPGTGLPATILAALDCCLALIACGGALPAPDPTSWAAVEGWYQQVGAATAIMTGLRLVALLGAVWVGGAACLQLLATCSPRAKLRRLADAVSPPVLRHLAGGTLCAVATLPLLPTEATHPSSDPPGTAVMEVVDEPTPDATPAPSTTIAPAPAPSADPVAASQSPPADHVVVAAGDSFWSLAAEAVADAGGDATHDREVARYWLRLIEANRSNLVDPGNADLLLPGQRLHLPST
jgi:hypothetical protein